MGLNIGIEAATRVFSTALTLAQLGGGLPAEWLERTRKIAQARSKTFTPMLGTALLARATEPSVDALSLRAGYSDRAYSARSLAKSVLVPCCANAGIDLRNKGPEPLNNQPFLRADRVTRALHVPQRSQGELEYLCEALEAVNELGREQARLALAAFLRERVDKSRAPVASDSSQPPLTALDALRTFHRIVLKEESQPLAAALIHSVLCLADQDARIRPANSANESWPGQLVVMKKGRTSLAMEVWTGTLIESEVLLFADRVASAGLTCCIVAVFAERSSANADQLEYQAQRLHGVSLSVINEAERMLRYWLLLSSMSAIELGAQLVRRTLETHALLVDSATASRASALVTQMARVLTDGRGGRAQP